MNIMMKLLKDLTPLNRVFCSAGYDHAVSYLQKLLPFRVIGFQKEDNHNGWVIPPRWEVREAKILRDGKVLYDGKESPLGVISLSTPFQGKVGLEELKRHLFYDHRYEDAIPYHFRLLYRPWARDWGFCVPRRLFDRLGPGDYEVIIETEEEEGDLKILEYTHKGALNDTIVFAAHLDHPGMANDGLSGCAVGVELFRRLLPKKTKFSYKLFLHQEIIGSQYYLLRKVVEKGERLVESIFLEMLGSRTPLALQASRTGNTMIEQALAKTLEEEKITHRRGAFGSIVVNGDYVWESFSIPMASFSRFPYPEYHTDRDTFAIMDEGALNESLEILLKTIALLESSQVVVKKFQGNICLSNPEYNLYVDPGQPAFGRSKGEDIGGMRKLMDIIPMIARPIPAEFLAREAGVSTGIAMDYLRKWADKGLVTIV
jgi:aminopeptidase-like protein